MNVAALIERLERSPGFAFVERAEDGQPRIVQHELARELLEQLRPKRERFNRKTRPVSDHDPNASEAMLRAWGEVAAQMQEGGVVRISLERVKLAGGRDGFIVSLADAETRSSREAVGDSLGVAVARGYRNVREARARGTR